MKIKIEYTAHLKRAAATDSEEIELGQGASVSEVIEAILERHGEAMKTLLLDAEGRVHPSLVIAVNGEQVFLDSSKQLTVGDTVVLLAAIAGG